MARYAAVMHLVEIDTGQRMELNRGAYILGVNPQLQFIQSRVAVDKQNSLKIKNRHTTGLHPGTTALYILMSYQAAVKRLGFSTRRKIHKEIRESILDHISRCCLGFPTKKDHQI